jgi:hypothetical protein
MRKFLIATVVSALALFGFPLETDASIDAILTPQTYSALNTACTQDHAGSIASITDGPSSPNWDQAVSGGGGSSTVAIYCDGTAWRVMAGGNPSATGPGTLSAPITNQGNYGTGCSGSCLLYDETWQSSSLDSSKWIPALYINNQYLNGGIGLTSPYSAWTICNCNGGTETVFFDYSYGQRTNTPNTNFVPLAKAGDGSLQLTFGPNTTFAGQGANYIGASISSAYSTATEIPASGGLMQWRAKFDSGLQYGSYPGVQCSATGAHYPTDSGTTYNSNFEFGYTWTGTPMTDVAFSINNVSASSENNNGTLSTGVYKLPSTNNLSNWHTFAVEYTGDTTGKKWQFYVDGVLEDSGAATQPNGTVFNCAFYITDAPPADSTWRTVITDSNPPPFSFWISEIEFFKRPGT